MKALAVLFSLSILGMAAAMPPGLVRKSTLSTSPDISLEQAAAMGKIEQIEVASTLAAAALPINENGLSGPCKDVTVLFAKGTGEEGNMGDGSSPGPAWVDAIRNLLGTDAVAVQGIDYNADVIGYVRESAMPQYL